MRRIDRRTSTAQTIEFARLAVERRKGRAYADDGMGWTSITALRLDVDPDVVESMTHRGRTWISCHECGQAVAAVVEMGEDGYEVRTCRDCLIAALDLLPEPREVMP
jgi:hypothetical protein